MVYLFVFFIVLWGIYKYDFCGKVDNGNILFLYILLLCISISAFKFRVGSDILVYIEEYKTYKSLDVLRIRDLFVNSNRQPGWVILVALFKSISSSFILFQFVQAAFINVIIFFFARKYTRYVFSFLLFYLVYLYAELNFEVMRESFAVGFFLLSIDPYRRKKWWLYYLLVFLAFSFHLSAFFLFLLPLIRFLPINKFCLLIYFGFLSVLLLCLLPLLSDFFSGLMLLGAIEEKATSYLNNDKYVAELTINFLLKGYIYFSLSYYVSVWYAYKTKRVWVVQIVILYFLFDILNKGIPFFYRFNNYLFPIFLLLLVESVFLLISNSFFKRCRLFALVALLALFAYFPMKSYFILSEDNQVPVYRKYYPYYSIFSGKIDRQRERTFN